MPERMLSAPAPAMARPPSHKPPRPAAAAPAAPHPGVLAQIPKPETAASCGPGSAGQAKACRVLDQKNAALTSKLVELEGKIKILQQELLPGRAGLKPQPVGAPEPLKPKPKPLSATTVKKAPSTSLMPLALVAGGAVALLLLIGAAAYLYRRRKKAAVPSEPSKYWVLLRKPFRRKKALEGADAAPVEPILEQ